MKRTNSNITRRSGLWLLLGTLSLNLAASDGPDTAKAAQARKEKARTDVYREVIIPITPSETWRARMSRRISLPQIWFETEMLPENSEAPGEFSFRIRERRRSAGLKAHPRDNLIVLTGYAESTSGKVYLFDSLTNKYLPAAKHRRVVDGKTAARIGKRLVK